MQLDIFQSEKELEKELEVLENALSKYRQHNDKHGEASQLEKMGIILIKLFRYDEAIENLKAALEFFEGINDKTEVSRIIATIGLALFELRKFDEAIENYKEAIRIIEDDANRKMQAIEYINYYGQIG